jgi:hypothetical protein
MQATLAALAASVLPGSVRAGTVHGLQGQLFVNGRRAEGKVEIHPGDELLTGPDSTVSLSIGADAFLLRSLTAVRFDKGPDPLIVTGLRLLTGGLMGVFGRGHAKRIQTATVTAGIRGTGVYLEAIPDATYFCTCYGHVELECLATGTRIDVKSSNHTPYSISPNARRGRTINEAAVMSHHNSELAHLESLVGRKSPLD